MSGLHTLQRDFQRYLLYLDKGMIDQVTGTAQASAEERLGIYANAYRLRLIEVLEGDYPGVHTLVGDEQYDRLCRAYIDAYPSDHPNIRRFGRHMGKFLRARAPYSNEPVLAEMAAFEWTLRDTFDGEDSVAIDVQAMVAMPPDAWASMRIILVPTASWLDLRWNVPTLWQAIDRDQEPETPCEFEYPLTWLIWRHELQTHFRSLEVHEAWALRAVHAGELFADLCAGLCEWVDEQHVASTAAGFLRRWVSDGMVARVER